MPHRSTSLAERTGGRVPGAPPAAGPPPGPAATEAPAPVPDPAPAQATGRATGQASGQATGPRPQRHCWVVDGAVPQVRAPGLLVEWRQLDGAWQGRVAYVVGVDDEATLVEAWLPASQLVRAFPTSGPDGVR